MDPLTHALLGAAAARVALARPLGRGAWLPGAVGALLPDADALVRSTADPLLYAEFHRHFTHSLAFIPIGGVLAALPWLVSRRAQGHPLAWVGAATVGYATHGVLDASTTYGTLLLWPFSDARIGWSWISIVDPVFTLLLLAGVALALWRGRARPAALALLLCALYLGAGGVQRGRALEAQRRVAESRGHRVLRGDAFPTLGNHLVWRSLYQSGDTLYLDRIRVPWRGPPTWKAGTGVALLREESLPPAVLATPRQREDFRRFRWFASGWVALAPGDPRLIGDARYSLRAAAYDPVWGIRFRQGASVPPTEWVDRTREREPELSALLREVAGRGRGHLPLPAGSGDPGLR